MKDISSHLFIPQQEKHGLIGNGKRHNHYYKTPWKGGKEIFLTGCIHSDNKRERKQDDRACFSMANTLICNSIHITLQLDALYTVFWRKLQCKMKQVANWFDANRMVFQRDFISHFALTFVTSWMPTHCELLQNSTYLKWGWPAFRIRRIYKEDCLYFSKIMNYASWFASRWRKQHANC